jgi:hypothetical protein
MKTAATVEKNCFGFVSNLKVWKRFGRLREDQPQTANGADPKRFVEPRCLKELEDSSFVAQLYKMSLSEVIHVC